VKGVRIEKSWKQRLKGEFEKTYFDKLTEFVRAEYKSKRVYPSPSDIFRAFDLCSFDDVKVVIIGQDPYHGQGQAHGLCFSVQDDVKVPPSLQNIYKEIVTDVGGKVPASGNLESWAQQGVLLLNATLTVVAGQAGSHQGKGWEEFTDAVIDVVNREKEGVVFMLWGRYAQNKAAMIDESKHLVLKAAHPSPFSAHSGFFGCKHFSKANEYLREHGKEEVRWV